MKAKKTLIIAAILLVVAILLYGGLYFSGERFKVAQYAKNNNLYNCGYEDGSYSRKIRDCVLDAFKTCKPAYAKAHSDGVAWEASGYDKTLTIFESSQGECIVQYIANGQSAFGPYSQNNFCKSVSMSGPGFGGGQLLLGDCEGADGTRTF